ncbi:MAG: hypothetical protein DHS20C18_00280 [Saprospiraceae bacterium]|nr:MAG: hypothetical protein DHS20C18_00280 [Saprospiraceae bacterium]
MKAFLHGNIRRKSQVGVICNPGDYAKYLCADRGLDVIPYINDKITLPQKEYKVLYLWADLKNGTTRKNSYLQGLRELKKIWTHPYTIQSNIILVSMLPSYHPDIEAVLHEIPVKFRPFTQFNTPQGIIEKPLSEDSLIKKAKAIIWYLLCLMNKPEMHDKYMYGGLGKLVEHLQAQEFDKLIEIRDEALQFPLLSIQKCLNILKAHIEVDHSQLFSHIYNRKHECFSDLIDVILNHDPINDFCLPCFKTELSASIKSLILNFFSTECEFYKYFSDAKI